MFYSLLSIYIRNAYVDFGKSEYKTFFSYMSSVTRLSPRLILEAREIKLVELITPHRRQKSLHRECNCACRHARLINSGSLEMKSWNAASQSQRY